MTSTVISILSCAIAAFCLVVNRGHAAGGNLDYGSQDRYRVCNKPEAPARGTLLQDRWDSVFAVLVKRREGWQRTGTATLIDDTGIFLTAAHAVYFDKNRDISIRQKYRGKPSEFPVRLLSSPDNFEQEDYVLLQAVKWDNKPSRFPYPVRFDNSDLANADFIGFEESKEEPVHKTVVFYSKDETGRYYKDMIFGHSSGALLYDPFGRAFSIVIKHGAVNIETLSGLPPERLAEEWNKRATISVFPLERAIETLKVNMPASRFMKELIQVLQAEVDPDKVPGDLNTRATALDIIFLIDEVFFGKIHEKWWQLKSAKEARVELLDRLRAAADDLCVASYFAGKLEDYSEAVESGGPAAKSPVLLLPASEGSGGSRPAVAQPETGAPRPDRSETNPAEESILDDLKVDTPEAATGLGLRFLERALAAARSEPSSPSVATKRQTRLAIELLRRATDTADVRRAQERGATNRNYAAVFADLAVAEDLGVRHGVGTRAAAERAVRAAIALGGSPTAYQLAGRYASEAGDPGAAASFYARAFAMLSPRQPRERAIREELKGEFDTAAAQAGAPNSNIAEFDVTTLRNRGTSSWQPLAAWGKAGTVEAQRLSEQISQYYSTGQYQRAIPLALRLLAITEKSLGPDGPHTAVMLNNLGVLYHATGADAEAEPIFKRALAIDEKVLGRRHPDTLASLRNLANLYGAQRRYAEAELLYREALQTSREALGPHHPGTVASLSILAELYRAQGRYAEAEPLYREALEARREVLGPRQVDTLASLSNLAALYQAQGRYGDAEPLYREALRGREAALGPRHRDTLASLDNLAVLYQAQGRYSDAEPLYQEALAGREAALGPLHPDTAVSLNNLAALYQVQGHRVEAEPLYRKALAIDEKSYGPDHPNVARDLHGLAVLLSDTDRPGEAEPLLRRALAIDEKNDGPDHPNIARDLYSLAELMLRTNRTSEADLLFKRALAIAEKNRPDRSNGVRDPNALEVLLGPAGKSQCVWFGERAVALVWKDDLDTAFRHLEVYDRFGCPSERIQLSLRCVVRHGAIDPKEQRAAADSNKRVHDCWVHPALPATPATPPGVRNEMP